MERIYNKLVRDNIPSIIEGKGETPITRILNEEEYKKELEKKLYEEEYKKELEKKLYEEYHEVLEASGEDRVEELADMIEVIKYLAKLEGKKLEDVIKTADEKSTKRGAFNDRIFLEKVIEDK